MDHQVDLVRVVDGRYGQGDAAVLSEGYGVTATRGEDIGASDGTVTGRHGQVAGRCHIVVEQDDLKIRDEGDVAVIRLHRPGYSD